MFSAVASGLPAGITPCWAWAGIYDFTEEVWYVDTMESHGRLLATDMCLRVSYDMAKFDKLIQAQAKAAI